MMVNLLDRHTGPIFDGLLRGIAGHVGRQRHEGNHEEQRQRAALQLLAAFGERQQQDAEGNDGADGRHMVQQQMQVDERRKHV
jgi:hypothetical protein